MTTGELQTTLGYNLARLRRGAKLSGERLADKVQVTRQTIYNYESGKTFPDGVTLTRLASALGVGLDQLLRPGEQMPPFLFRAHGEVIGRPQFISETLQVLQDYLAVERLAGAPSYVPEATPCTRLDAAGQHQVISIAHQFRHRLGVGVGPICNLFGAVENLGLKVVRRPFEDARFCGLSACSHTFGAFVLLNTHEINIERQLFTLAHEIGHLILHRDEYSGDLSTGGSPTEETEREKIANYFAGQLLVPEEALKAELTHSRNILRLKAHFRVSYQVILHRLEELGHGAYGTMSAKLARQYKQHTGHVLSKKLELEPCLCAEDFPRNERLTLLCLTALRNEAITELRVAEVLRLPIVEVRRLRKEWEDDVIVDWDDC